MALFFTIRIIYISRHWFGSYDGLYEEERQKLKTHNTISFKDIILV